jgi:putative hydrolase of the HAD superfamily
VATPGAPPLVVFDLGGVLVRICRSWVEACEAAGVSHRAGERPLEDVLRESGLVTAYEVGGLDDGTFFKGASRALGDEYTAQEVERVHDAWVRGEYESAARLLDALEAGGVETGILSNTNAAHWRRMLPPDSAAPTSFPTLRRVRHAHASHLLRAAKPSREAFARFEAATGRFGPDVLFFDDAPANAAAARAHGWRAHVLDPAGDPPEEAAGILRKEGVL